jgi:hypothetical protein
MATPAKSVQARDVDSVVEMYTKMGIPAFGIRQNGTMPFKYTGNSMEQGAAELQWILEKLEDSESAAIYQLAMFENPGKVNEKTPADLSIGFQLNEHTRGWLPHEQYKGSYGAVLGEIRELKKTIDALQKEKEAEPESKLGIVGEIMELEGVQPIVMAIGNRIADWVMGTGDKAVGELKRVSGIPGYEPEPPAANGQIPPAGDWRTDIIVIGAIDRLADRVPDLGGLLTRLADLAEKKPGQFNLYAAMLRKMK